MLYRAAAWFLRYEVIPGRDQTVIEKIRQVQEGAIDMLMPLSLQAERAQLGIFTAPYYETYYVVIARKGRRLPISDLADLARYRVGIVGGVSFESILKDLVPASRLRMFDQSATADGLFQAVRDGEIDVAVFNKSIFIEKRYQYELFDLEAIHTLYHYPRAYRFYFSRSPQHQHVAAAFDRYLEVMDISESVVAHEDAERQFIAYAVSQRSQRILMQAASVVAALLALAFYLALRRHRRLTLLLADSNRHILQQQQALRVAYEELEKQSQTDGLTRLANRRHFDQALVREHGRHLRTNSPLSLLLIDVDHFKSVNDHYGHVVGDDYLRAIARALERSAARPTDLAARYGGEEFACLLPDTAAEEALTVAERICAAVAQLDLPNASAAEPHLTVSIGAATLLSGGAGARELLDGADAQLYEAKHAGRNRIRAMVLGG
ncbi:GGDEF domain-containing protein [Castellaniella sp. GW247-6E4]|uniref:GGDEF domain-containing protein n=1 Tax=Castellaniella sp. GW247-6E4 TaxID=3140380 RepID=UPI003315B632